MNPRFDDWFQRTSRAMDERRSDARLRLFCFPYSGGATSSFRRWGDALSRDIAVFPVELPGRERRLREPAFRSMEPLLDYLACELAPCLGRNYALFGHSLGALIGFELARMFQACGRPPLHLFLSGAGLSKRPPSPGTRESSGKDVIEKLRELHGTSELVLNHEELMQVLRPCLEADFEIAESYTYRPGVPLNCPISVFGGIDDEHVPAAELEEWRGETTAHFSLRMFPGDHFFLRSEQSALIEEIRTQLTRSLDRLEANGA